MNERQARELIEALAQCELLPEPGALPTSGEKLRLLSAEVAKGEKSRFAALLNAAATRRRVPKETLVERARFLVSSLLPPETADHYTLLGVEPSASADAIRSRFRQLVRQYHPDQYAGEGLGEYVRRLNEAYRVLSDPERRHQYDQERHRSARRLPVSVPAPDLRRWRLHRRMPQLVLGTCVLLAASAIWYRLGQRHFLQEPPRIARQSQGVQLMDRPTTHKELDSLDPAPLAKGQSVTHGEKPQRLYRQRPNEVLKNQHSETSRGPSPSAASPSVKSQVRTLRPISSPEESPRPTISTDIRQWPGKTEARHPSPMISKTSQNSASTEPPTIIDPVPFARIEDQVLPTIHSSPAPPLRDEPRRLFPSPESVMAVIEAYREAYEQRDLERFMHLWGQRIRDRDMTDREELQQRYAENFASLDKIRYELTNVKMSPLTGGRVRVSARYRIGAILRSAGEEIVGEGHIRWTLRKEDGELRIVGIDY